MNTREREDAYILGWLSGHTHRENGTPRYYTLKSTASDFVSGYDHGYDGRSLSPAAKKRAESLLQERSVR